MVCFALSENREMEREPHCRFCKTSLISGKRTNTVPVFGVSRNKTLLVDSGQDCVVLAQSFESLRFPLEEGESFSDLSCLTCAREAVRLAKSVSNLTSRCNERTWNAKGDIMTSPEREASKTSQSTKRSAALRSPTGITPTGKRNKDEIITTGIRRSSVDQTSSTSAKTSRRSLTFTSSNEKIKEQEESPLTLEEKMQESMDIPQGHTKTVVKVSSKLN